MGRQGATKMNSESVKPWKSGKDILFGERYVFGVQLQRTFLFESRQIKVLSEYLCKERDVCGDTGETVC